MPLGVLVTTFGSISSSVQWASLVRVCRLQRHQWAAAHSLSACPQQTGEPGPLFLTLTWGFIGSRRQHIPSEEARVDLLQEALHPRPTAPEPLTT